MKTTLNLNDRLLTKAKIKAKQDGITLTRFVEEALNAKLVPPFQHRSKFKFKPVVIEGSKPPNVDISNRDALYDIIDNR